MLAKRKNSILISPAFRRSQQHLCQRGMLRTELR
jgi:hypothetical protein